MTHFCPEGNPTCWNTAGHMPWEPLVIFLMLVVTVFGFIIWRLR